VEPAQPTVVPSPPVEPTTPAVVAPVAKPNSPPVPAPLPVAEKTPPHPSVEPRKVEPPKPKRVTLEQLQARLAKLEQRLAAREAETGEKDRVLRQFLDQARKDIAAASTDEKRKEAAKFLDEIQGQFPK
jgi:hypothetical protein